MSGQPRDAYDAVLRQMRRMARDIDELKRHRHPVPRTEAAASTGALTGVFRQSGNAQTIDAGTLEVLSFAPAGGIETVTVGDVSSWTITDTAVTVPEGVYICGGGAIWNNPEVGKHYLDVQFTEGVWPTFPATDLYIASTGSSWAQNCGGWQMVFSSSDVRLRARNPGVAGSPLDDYFMWVAQVSTERTGASA